MKTQKQYWQKLQDPRWQRKRLEILNQAEFCCEGCGDTESQLQVHHGYYEKGKEPWEYEDDTLWCLCDKCHEKAHALKNAIDVALAKYRPTSLLPFAVGLGIINGRDSSFYARLQDVMRQRPGIIERTVDALCLEINTKKGQKQ